MKDALFGLLVKCKSLQEFTEASAKLIGVPYWLMDVTFQFLGMSSSSKAYRDKILENQDIYEQAMKWLNAGFEDKIRRLEKPLRIHDDNLGMDITVFDVYVSGTLSARMTLFSGDIDQETVILLAQACSVYLRSVSGDSGGLMENMLMGLIDGTISRKDVEKAKEMTGWDLPAPYRFYLVKADGCQSSSIMRNVAHQIRLVQPRSVVMHRQDRCVILASEKYPLDALLDRYNVIAGRSCPFSDLGLVQSASIQADYALDKGQGKIRSFEPLGMQFLAGCLKEHLEMEIFLPPVFHEMTEYDARYNTSYFQTLCSYYKCSASKEKTARYLGVHLNTVKYRLTQMHQLFGIDPDQQREELSFYITLKKAIG